MMRRDIRTPWSLSACVERRAADILEDKPEVARQLRQSGEVVRGLRNPGPSITRRRQGAG